MQVSETLAVASSGTTSACALVLGNREFVCVGSRDGLVVVREVGSSFERTLTHSAKAALLPSSFNGVISGSGGGGGATSATTSTSAKDNNNQVSVSALTHSRTHSLLVSAADDGSLVVWSTRDTAFQRIHSLRAHTAAVSAIVFDPTPSLNTNNNNNNNTNNNSALKRSPSLASLSQPASTSSAAAPNCIIYTASFDKLIHIWDLNVGKRIHSLSGHSRPILCLAIHSQSLFSAGMDSDVRVWDTTTNECIRTLKDPYGSIDILSVSAGINVVYAGARDGGVRVWNVQTGKCVKVLGIAAPAKDSTVPSSESEEGEAEYVHPSEARSAAATDSRDAVAALNPSSSNANNEPSTLPALVDAVVGTVQRRASFILSSASQTLFGTGDSNTNNNYGNKPSAVRTVSIGLLPGQVFSAGDDAIIYEWDVKSGNIVRKYDNHSAGILWVSVEKPVEGETSFSTGRLYSASLDGCVRVFEIDGGITTSSTASNSKQFPLNNYKPPPRAAKEPFRRSSTPVLASTSSVLLQTPSHLRAARPVTPLVTSTTADADEEIESTTQKPRNLSPFQDSTTPHDPTAASTIATLRAQLERAHALLSTQSQLTHRLKSELTVTRSHIATVKNELHQRTAEVATLKSTGLEDRVKRLEREARDGRDAALVALEYITRQGSMVGLEIEAEVMGVMRLLESPWTPLIMNGGEGLESGVGVKPVKRVWESDSEFDSDVDAEREIDEADAWWRADILKVVEHVGSVSSNSQQQQQQQVQQQQVGHQRVVGFRESTYESAYTSSDEDASSEQSTEDELNVLLPPTARRARKGSARHRWSTMSLTRPVLAYHESFNKRNSISILDIDSSDDTEEDELIQSISRRSSYSSPVPFPPPPPRPMSSSTFSRGFLERIPEDDDYLDAQIEGLGGEIHAIGGAIGRRGAGDTIDMIALTDVESMSSVNGDVKSPVVEAGELQQEQQQQVADVVDRGLDYVQLEGLGGLSVTPMKGNHDSGIDLTTVESFVPQVERPSSRIDRPSSRLLWHQPQPAQEEKKTAEAPILTQDGELNNILWSGAVKPVVPDTTSTAQAVVADPELESVVWTGNVRSLKGSAKPTVAQLTPEQLIVGSPESVIFTGVVKSKKAPVTNAAQIQQQEQDFLADAESIMWKGSVKSKKGTKKMAQDLASNPQDAALEDAESIVWRGNVKSKKSTTQAAKSQAGGSYAGDDAESIVYRGPVKSRRGNTINESQAESYKDSPMDDAESIVWKGTVKSKKSTTRKAKSVFSGHGEEDSGDEVASVKPSQAFVMDEDLESVMWQGSVKSSTRAIPKLSTSLKQSSSLKQTAVWEGNGAKIAEQVVTSPTQQSGFGDFAKVPLPEPVTEASGFFSGILKPIVEAAKTPVPPPQPTPAEALKPDPKDQVKKMNSLSWFATGPIAEQQQQEQPYTRPTASSSWFNAAVDDEEKKKPIPPNNVKPKASSNWFTAALTGSAVEEEEEMAMFDVSNNPPVRPNPPSQVKPKASSSWFTPITNIFQAIADLVPEEEEASLQVANSTTETLFETTDFDGKKWQKSEPAPASVTLASATAGGKKERPSSFIRPARPASVIKKRPTSLLHPRPDSSMSIHVESVVEFDEEVKAPVQVPIPAPVQAVERPSRRVLPPAAVSDKNASSIKKTGRRCKSLDTRPAVTAPTFNRSRRHSISIADETLRQEIKPTFLAGIPQRNSVPSTLTAQAPAAITSPVQIDDSASESSSSHRSHLSTPPLLSDEEHILRDRPLTPSRRTTSAVPTAASPTNNNRIKKRGSVSSSLHSDYVAPTAPQTNRRKSSFKPLAYDSGITEDSPKVDQLAAAFENVMEAAIETPWHLVPKWLVIDEGEGGAAAATAQEEEQQHGDVVVIEG